MRIDRRAYGPYGAFFAILLRVGACLAVAAGARATELINTADCVLDAYVTGGGRPSEQDHPLDAVIQQIEDARQSIDFAIHDIDEPRVISSLVDAASRGVRVRLLTDSQGDVPETGGEQAEKAIRKVVALEILRRGKDGVIGTADDVFVFAESPIAALKDAPIIRRRYGLPSNLGDDLAWPPKVYVVGNSSIRQDWLVAEGYSRSRTPDTVSRYYASGTRRMHHKFLVIDLAVVGTGSMNATVSTIYGTLYDKFLDNRAGHREHWITIRNREIAEAFNREFNLLWGSSGIQPDPAVIHTPRWKSRKLETYQVCSGQISLAFTPNSHARKLIADRLSGAQSSIVFELFSFTEPALVKAFVETAMRSTPKVALFGTVDARFIDRFKEVVRKTNSTAVDYLFTGASGFGANEQARVVGSSFGKKLHAKTAIIDGARHAEEVVITGSFNWSTTGLDSNLETIVVTRGIKPLAEFFQNHMRELRRRMQESELLCM